MHAIYSLYDFYLVGRRRKEYPSFILIHYVMIYEISHNMFGIMLEYLSLSPRISINIILMICFLIYLFT